ncbi:MAG: zinc ribbon domain-containing protein [Acidobacteriota bacterium]
MFCPTCGRDNLTEQKFCASCGTNLEAVSQALSGSASDFFTRIDTSLDQFIARYAEHVFKDAPANATDRSVSNSWKLLGRGALTSFVDLFLSLMIWNVFTVRFYMLLFSTPFRLLSERSRRLKSLKAGIDKATPRSLPDSLPNQWFPGSVPSVSEHTTERLQQYQPPRQEHTSNKD